MLSQHLSWDKHWPVQQLPRLWWLRSRGLLCRAAAASCAAVCTTKPITSFVEAFNDLGVGSSLGMLSAASRIPPSVAACSRNPQGAELTLAPWEMCYRDVQSLLYFHSDHPHLQELELNSAGKDLAYASQAWPGCFWQGC